MPSGKIKNYSARIIAFVGALVAVIVITLVAVIVLSNFVNTQLTNEAERQVVTYAEESAESVRNNMFGIQDAIGAFTVQTDDPELVQPALYNLKDRMGFFDTAFINMSGNGITAYDRAITLNQISREETAISKGEESYSNTYDAVQGVRVRLAQQPLFIDGKQIGALYVQIPMDLFAVNTPVDMFEGPEYTLVFDSKSGEILVSPENYSNNNLRSGMSIFDFLGNSIREDSGVHISTSNESLDAEAVLNVGMLQSAVESGSTAFMLAELSGELTYICMAPVGSGRWYVATMLPVSSVHTEAGVVNAAFYTAIACILLCLAVIVGAFFVLYHRRIRNRNVEMMSQLYQALSESVNLAVNLFSPEDNKVTPIVKKTESILGYALDEFLANKRYAKSVNLSDEGKKLFDRIKMGSIVNLERGEFSFISSRDSSTKWVSYSVNPLTYDNKRQLLIVLRDITSEKNIQLSMRDAMMAAEAANSAKSDFLSRMSHEIRTPMNGILGMLNLVRSSMGNKKQMEDYLDKADAASEHLLQIVNDVLDLSKIESGSMTLIDEPFSLQKVLDDVSNIIRVQCEQRNQQYTDSRMLGEATSGTVYSGDALNISRMLINLLSNASKYASDGGHVKLETVVAESKLPGYREVTFIVKDDGIGMSDGFTEHLFEPFVMEGRSKEQGTGLGMTIVKNIVNMMGGSIDVHSVEGVGTEFRVILTLRLALGSSVAKSGNPTPTELNSLAGKRIMVVEDDELNAEIACELLKQVGIEVERAVDGLEAYEMFEASVPGYYDGILMDVKMPRMDGYEASRRIRSSEHADAENIPIVAMSANAFSEDVRGSLLAGMNAHLSKPIDIKHVIATMAELITD